MSLSTQDREWVREIIKSAASETLSVSNDNLWKAIKDHRVLCPISLLSEKVDKIAAEILANKVERKLMAAHWAKVLTLASVAATVTYTVIYGAAELYRFLHG